MYYNKAIFREAGLDPDKFPETWTEFMAVCEKVNHVRGNSQYAYGFYGSAADINTPIQWETLVRSLGGFAIDPDTNKVLMGNPETVKAAEFYRDLIAKGYVPKSVLGYDGDALLNDFVEGNLAMIMNGSWQYPDMLKAGMKKEDIGYAYIPRADNGKFATIGGAWALCISSATKNPQLAWKLIQHLFTDDFFKWEIENAGQVPTREKFFALVENDPFLSFIANYSLKFGQAELHSKYFLEDAQALCVSLNTAIGGSVDIKSSFDKISEELNRKHVE
jgi:ABC-type glycerol-3-phosphate transport system substrate-binding protein